MKSLRELMIPIVLTRSYNQTGYNDMFVEKSVNSDHF